MLSAGRIRVVCLAGHRASKQPYRNRVATVWKKPLVFVRIRRQDLPPLPQVGLTNRGPGLLSHPPQSRQQDRHQQRNHGQHHQQLNQRKAGGNDD
jgi:hypothetical protein